MSQPKKLFDLHLCQTKVTLRRFARGAWVANYYTIYV